MKGLHSKCWSFTCMLFHEPLSIHSFLHKHLSITGSLYNSVCDVIICAKLGELNNIWCQLPYLLNFNFFLSVDDGTGCLSCCVWHNQNNDLVEATFGDLVTVMGKISVFREERQITASSFCILQSKELSSC
jgi:hypothetical protein